MMHIVQKSLLKRNIVRMNIRVYVCMSIVPLHKMSIFISRSVNASDFYTVYNLLHTNWKLRSELFLQTAILHTDSNRRDLNFLLYFEF